MARRDESVRKTLEQDLADLKLFRIAEIIYRKSKKGTKGCHFAKIET